MIETKPKRSLQHWFDHVRIRPKRIRRQRPRRERKFETMDESVRIPYRRKDKQHGH